jgi:arsenite-transporting ATPase
VLGVELGPQPRRIAERLDAMEVDARGMFGEAAQSADKNSAMGKMMQLASETPGVDEFGAIEVLLQVLENAQHDVVVVDTAPTGHTLRLLMVPELLDGWLGTLLSLRTRIARAGRLLRRFLPGGTPDAAALEQDLTGSRERIRVLRDQLTDADQAQIILVSIPEEMSVLETTRTMQMLSGHGMPVGTVVVNQLQPESDHCVHCERRREIHVTQLARLRGAVGAVPLRVVESQPRAIRGLDELAQMGLLLWEPEPTAESDSR